MYFRRGIILIFLLLNNLNAQELDQITNSQIIHLQPQNFIVTETDFIIQKLHTEVVVYNSNLTKLNSFNPNKDLKSPPNRGNQWQISSISKISDFENYIAVVLLSDNSQGRRDRATLLLDENLTLLGHILDPTHNQSRPVEAYFNQFNSTQNFFFVSEWINTPDGTPNRQRLQLFYLTQEGDDFVLNRSATPYLPDQKTSGLDGSFIQRDMVEDIRGQRLYLLEERSNEITILSTKTEHFLRKIGSIAIYEPSTSIPLSSFSSFRRGQDKDLFRYLVGASLKRNHSIELRNQEIIVISSIPNAQHPLFKGKKDTTENSLPTTLLITKININDHSLSTRTIKEEVYIGNTPEKLYTLPTSTNKESNFLFPKIQNY